MRFHLLLAFDVIMPAFPGKALRAAEPADITRSVERWMDVLQKSRDAGERRKAADELGKLGPKARPAVAVLIGATDDEDEGVQLKALHALGEIGAAAKEAIPTLISTS